jgi:hypothetical protein|tara:strand:+ start:784 stop:1035 length:252 start_codon:yes stop_codon:yes gene_type:complete
MIFLAKPSVYHLPGTWEKQPLIEPGLAIPVIIGIVVIGLLGYGIYMTFGSGGKDLRDEIDEHSKMHELGIAHGHSPKTKHRHD